MKPSPLSSLDAADLAQMPGLVDLWAESLGDARVVIAVLDGSVDRSHPALNHAELNAVTRRIPAFGTAGSSAAHGTLVAGIIFGSHSSPVRGIAPHCKGIIAPIFEDGDDGGVLACTQLELAETIRSAVDDADAHVINISAGQLADPGTASTALVEAVRYCEEKNRLIIAAAGNDGCAECLHIPGGLPSPAVLVVGAMNHQGEPLGVSNWGAIYREQGIVAPGERILGAGLVGTIEPGTGTSFATAVVSGVAALLLSLQLKYGRTPDPQAIRRAILESALGCESQPVPECERLLAGRLNVSGAMLLMKRGIADMAHQIEPLGCPPTANTGQPFHGGTAETPAPGIVQASTQPDSGRIVEAASGAGSPPVGGTAPAEEFSASGSMAASPPIGTYHPSGVVPSGCGCGGGSGGCSCGKGLRQLVYVVGDRLDYDFGTRVRAESMGDNFANGLLSRILQDDSLARPVNLLRYLLGWDGVTLGPGEGGPDEGGKKKGMSGKKKGASGGESSVRGSFYDVNSVHWVLYQDDCPRYAIQPVGAFAEAAYKQLLYFFIENKGILYDMYGIDVCCLDEYFTCHGGSSDPLMRSDAREDQPEPGEADAKGKSNGASDENSYSEFLGESPSRVARIAIAGEVVGKIQLATGEIIDAISPNLRGTASWNTVRLIEEAAQEGTGLKDNDARALAARVISVFYDEARNDGKSPEDRAKNWAATSMFLAIREKFQDSTFRNMLGGLQNAAVSGVTAQPSDCRQTGMEYDVEVGFYSFENTLRGEVVISSRVDVSEVVPVTLGSVRVRTRR